MRVTLFVGLRWNCWWNILPTFRSNTSLQKSSLQVFTGHLLNRLIQYLTKRKTNTSYLFSQFEIKPLCRFPQTCNLLHHNSVDLGQQAGLIPNGIKVSVLQLACSETSVHFLGVLTTIKVTSIRFLYSSKDQFIEPQYWHPTSVPPEIPSRSLLVGERCIHQYQFGWISWPIAHTRLSLTSLPLLYVA